MEHQKDIEANPKRSLFTIPPALRYPVFRKYWLGSLASVSGFQMFQANQFWLVHTLEDSPLFLGYVGLANAIPAIALNLFGGVFADKLEKRRLIRFVAGRSAHAGRAREFGDALSREQQAFGFAFN